MQTVKGSSWVRMALAFAAFFCVAGTGVVYAGAPTADYPAPRSGVLVGPSTVMHNSIAQYQLVVTFVDNSTATFNNAPATFSASSTSGPSGHFASPSSTYVAPSQTNPRVLLNAKYSNTNGSVAVNRIVSVN